MVDFTALGELLIDFTEAGRSPSGNRLFEQNAGGAPANAACAAAKFGANAAVIAKVGRDLHGDFLRETLQNANVDVSGVLSGPEAFTTLAFVAVGETGERRFSFARKPGADTCLREDELPNRLLAQTRILHVGSLSLTDEPARTATFAAVRSAKNAGALLSYDPNYRASLWESEATAVRQMRSLIPYADLMKLSDEETPLLTGEHDPVRALDALELLGVRLAVVTLGARGAVLRWHKETASVPGFAVPVTDTTGAGDIFWGAFLAGLLQSGVPLERLTLQEARSFARFANAAAALSVQKRGGIPSIPSKEAVEAFLAAHGEAVSP